MLITAEFQNLFCEITEIENKHKTIKKNVLNLRKIISEFFKLTITSFTQEKELLEFIFKIGKLEYFEIDNIIDFSLEIFYSSLLKSEQYLNILSNYLISLSHFLSFQNESIICLFCSKRQLFDYVLYIIEDFDDFEIKNKAISIIDQIFQIISSYKTDSTVKL